MDVEGLPEVDDFEVAALAALQAIQSAAATDSDRSESETSEASSEEEASSQDDGEGRTEKDTAALKVQAGVRTVREPLVRVWLTVHDGDSVACILTTDMALDDPGELSDSDVESEVFDAEQLRLVVDAMDDAEADGGNSAWDTEADPFPVQPLDVIITAEDQMLPIGSVSSILGKMIVIQGLPGCITADEDSVVCLGPTEPLGRIQEIFGPVQAPLYALGYAGCMPMPETLIVGASVQAVQRLSTFMQTEQLHMQERGGINGENDAEDSEAEFSDDEKEAEYRRALAAQREIQGMSPLSAGRGSHPARGRQSGSGRGARPGRGRQGGRLGQRQRQRPPPGQRSGPVLGMQAAQPFSQPPMQNGALPYGYTFSAGPYAQAQTFSPAGPYQANFSAPMHYGPPALQYGQQPQYGVAGYQSSSSWPQQPMGSQPGQWVTQSHQQAQIQHHSAPVQQHSQLQPRPPGALY